MLWEFYYEHKIEDYWFEKLEISDLCDVNFSFYASSGSLRKKLENSIMFMDEYFFTLQNIGFSITTDQRTQLLEQKNFKFGKSK